MTFAGLASADNRMAEPGALVHSWHPVAFSEHPSGGDGLMILIFYISRAGYDEAPQIEYEEAPEDA